MKHLQDMSPASFQLFIFDPSPSHKVRCLQRKATNRNTATEEREPRGSSASGQAAAPSVAYPIRATGRPAAASFCATPNIASLVPDPSIVNWCFSNRLFSSSRPPPQPLFFLALLAPLSTALLPPLFPPILSNPLFPPPILSRISATPFSRSCSSAARRPPPEPQNLDPSSNCMLL